MKKVFALVMLVYCCQSLVQAQDSKQDKKEAKMAAIRNIVDSQNYVFKAQSAMPLSGPWTKHMPSRQAVRHSHDRHTAPR